MNAQAVAGSFGLTITALQAMYNLVKRQAGVKLLPMALSEDFAWCLLAPKRRPSDRQACRRRHPPDG